MVGMFFFCWRWGSNIPNSKFLSQTLKPWLCQPFLMSKQATNKKCLWWQLSCWCFIVGMCIFDTVTLHQVEENTGACFLKIIFIEARVFWVWMRIMMFLLLFFDFLKNALSRETLEEKEQGKNMINHEINSPAKNIFPLTYWETMATSRLGACARRLCPGTKENVVQTPWCPGPRNFSFQFAAVTRW